MEHGGELKEPDDQKGVQIPDRPRHHADGDPPGGPAQDERRRHQQLVHQAGQDEEAELARPQRDVDGQHRVADDADEVAPVPPAQRVHARRAGHASDRSGWPM
jgi:hypothetical protein